MEEKKPLFLLVEDDEAMSKLMEVMLQRLECDVRCARNGKEALDRLQAPELAKQFDAIFIDVMMPEMNGFELAQHLKAMEHTRQIPLIMVTALSTYQDLMLGYQAGGDYYITKPVTLEQLTYALDLLLGDGGEQCDTGKRYRLRDAS